MAILALAVAACGFGEGTFVVGVCFGRATD